MTTPARTGWGKRPMPDVAAGTGQEVRVRPFGELEAAVMECLWSRAEAASVREVLTELQELKPLAYTTVMTVLDNLHRKRAVRREMVGRAWLYRPACTREQRTASLLRDVLGAAGDRKVALMHFVSELDPDDIAELTAAVKAVQRKRDRG